METTIKLPRVPLMMNQLITLCAASTGTTGTYICVRLYTHVQCDDRNSSLLVLLLALRSVRASEECIKMIMLSFCCSAYNIQQLLRSGNMISDQILQSGKKPEPLRPLADQKIPVGTKETCLSAFSIGMFWCCLCLFNIQTSAMEDQYHSNYITVAL